MMESMVIFHRCRSLAATDAFYIQQLGLTLWHTQPGCHIYDSVTVIWGVWKRRTLSFLLIRAFRLTARTALRSTGCMKNSKE